MPAEQGGGREWQSICGQVTPEGGKDHTIDGVKPRALELTLEHGVLVAEGDWLKLELSRRAGAEANELEL